VKLNTTREERDECRQERVREGNTIPFLTEALDDCDVLEDRVAELERELAWVRSQSQIKRKVAVTCDQLVRSKSKISAVQAIELTVRVFLEHLTSTPPKDWEP
jgi:DNA-binding phage protein